MKFLFDTGSSWLWVPSIDCPKDQCINDHYDYKKSTEFKSLDKKDKIKYGIGSVDGTVCNDVI